MPRIDDSEMEYLLSMAELQPDFDPDAMPCDVCADCYHVNKLQSYLDHPNYGDLDGVCCAACGLQLVDDDN